MTVAPATHRPLLGIALMCLAGTVLPFMNGFGKLLSATYPAEQVVWARFVSHLLWVLLLAGPQLGTALFRTARPGLQLARSLAMLSSSVIFFVALPHIGLAEASVINFVSPFLVMLLALPMLGERFVAHRLIGVTIGFAGVIVVIRPGADVFNWASVAIFVSSGFYALYQVLTRMVAGHDRPETSILYSVLAGSIAMSFVMPWVWTTPMSTIDAVLMASLGFIGAIGHYCLARAMFYAPASVISPFNYWQLIGAVGVGYALFASLPDAWTWIGAVLIVGAGLFIGWRETGMRGGGAQNSAATEK
ncbi:MAG: DMT family transporter [Alphaproteobacteria bacterium]|nr:DMT family transporter [Alphaproteobacteria bacterium]